MPLMLIASLDCYNCSRMTLQPLPNCQAAIVRQQLPGRNCQAAIARPQLLGRKCSRDLARL
jgi:hypothetical protein